MSIDEFYFTNITCCISTLCILGDGEQKRREATKNVATTSDMPPVYKGGGQL
jgi:hypothetical protein